MTNMGKGLDSWQQMKFEGIFTQEQARQICEEQDISIGYGYTEDKRHYVYLALNLMNAQDRIDMFNKLEEAT